MNKFDTYFLVLCAFFLVLALGYAMLFGRADKKPYTIICIEGVQHFQTGNETRPVVTVAGRFRGCE